MATFEIAHGPRDVQAARRLVERTTIEAGAMALASDAVLVASELLANACEHGEPPVTLRVSADPGHVLVEVEDSGPRSPVRALADDDSMTGRGLDLVEQVSTAWGVCPVSGGRKIVWGELGQNGSGGSLRRCTALATAAATAQHGADDKDRYTVDLGEVPTGLLVAAKAHVDNLVRELWLMSNAEDAPLLPDHLAGLVDTVVHRVADVREEIKQQARIAVARQQARTRLTLRVPADFPLAGEEYLTALDEADSYARAARLLTLETPPAHRLFRRWYVRCLIEHIRAAANGQAPPVIESFDAVLVREYSQVARQSRAGGRASRLQAVTAALALARTPSDVAAVVVSEGVSALGAVGGSLLVPATDGEHLAAPGTVGYGEQLVGQLLDERLDAPLPAATAMRTGDSVWVESQEDANRQFPELADFEPGTVAICAVPLVVGSDRLGALRFSFNHHRVFDTTEREFTLALAALTAHTLRRTEAYQAERRATRGLQRALLEPGAPLATPGWDVAAQCLPAGKEEVGGDFYDVLALPDGRLAVVVGDVMGRGLSAAAAMAQIRSAIRTHIVLDPDPVTVMERTDAYFDVLQLDQLVTVVYALATPGSDDVQVANAGHLPPLLVTPDGHVELIASPTGLPFGVEQRPRAAAVVSVPPGTSLVIVTDGLVERRGEDIDAGIERAAAAAASTTRTTAAALLEHVIASAPPSRDDDDVTVVVLRNAPERP